VLRSRHIWRVLAEWLDIQKMAAASAVAPAGSDAHCPESAQDSSLLFVTQKHTRFFSHCFRWTVTRQGLLSDTWVLQEIKTSCSSPPLARAAAPQADERPMGLPLEQPFARCALSCAFLPLSVLMEHALQQEQEQDRPRR
jgi:hypothetical protein